MACGASINFERLRFVAVRAELGGNIEKLSLLPLSLKPGSLKPFAMPGQANLSGFNSVIATDREASIFVGARVQGRVDAQNGLSFLSQKG